MTQNFVQFARVRHSDSRLRAEMSVHYSQPKGFVGRSICYHVIADGIRYGSIVGGSAVRHLRPRDEWIGHHPNLLTVVNNIFFHVAPMHGRYPFRNFVSAVLLAWCVRVAFDWQQKYGNPVLWIESLVELPRTGECYRRAGFTEVGVTKGYTCKRVAGKGTDSWTGRRVWNTTELRPKRIFVKRMALTH